MAKPASDAIPLLATGLIDAARALPHGLIFIAATEARAARIARIATGVQSRSDWRPAFLPAWDCLPYDRAAPSLRIMGHRMAVLRRFAERDPPPLLIASVDALSQKLPPPAAYTSLQLRRGGTIPNQTMRDDLRRLGYHLTDLADLSGDAAWRGEVLDILPPAETYGVRVVHDGDRITALRRFDPRTQRGTDLEDGEHHLGPASEWMRAADDDSAPDPHRLPEAYDTLTTLTTLFALMPQAALCQDDDVAAQRAARWQDVHDAYEDRLHLPCGQVPLPPDKLYLTDMDWNAALHGRKTIVVDLPETSSSLPRYRAQPEPRDAFRRDVETRLKAGEIVGLAGQRRATLAALLSDPPTHEVADWLALRKLPTGRAVLFGGDCPESFNDGTTTIVKAADVFGEANHIATDMAAALSGTILQVGDAVIHETHGLGVLRGLETVEFDGIARDCLRLEYARGESILAPVAELDRIWRYGADAGGTGLDHLKGDAWLKRLAQADIALRGTAAELLTLVRQRLAAKAPVIEPPPAAFARFVSRFPYELTSDQETATEAVLADLRCGHPMNRLVCGDVGFGKTEVALRAAAAVALAGYQVAIMAPTTVLVRQHLKLFRSRFAQQADLRVAQLSRLCSEAENRQVQAELARGDIAIVIGTVALASDALAFKKLGLVIVDEEQRFGTEQKNALRRNGVHMLSLSATPIPRTLQAAMVGLQDLSIVATPPPRRRTVRCHCFPFDPVMVRGALEHEHHAGGQSFVVAPRIQDLPDLREKLRVLVPDLRVIAAHGQMDVAEMEDAMLAFADGEADILLSTNIVETGLDVPRANTMVIWNADRFGLAQLHQLRGRVGRGGGRGVVHLLTDPAHPICDATKARLQVLEQEDRLGAGFAISTRDLDLRGAGELLGEHQAGHMKLIGAALYQAELQRAVALARGETIEDRWTPELSLASPETIPISYVPSIGMRLNLHLRLSRLDWRDEDAIDNMADEIEDRFGPMPDDMRHCLDLATLRLQCRRAGVSRLEVGPDAAAATLRNGLPDQTPDGLRQAGKRLLLTRASSNTADCLEPVVARFEIMDWQCHRKRHEDSSTSTARHI